MATGCDFICDNKNCEHYKKSITLLGSWNLTDINDVIENTNDENLKKHMEWKKQHGQKHACIIYPKMQDATIAGVRIQTICDQCYIIYENDILNDNIDSKNIIEKCKKCDSELKTINNFVNSEDDKEEHLLCPHCKYPMKKQVWFSNERTKNEQDSSK